MATEGMKAINKTKGKELAGTLSSAGDLWHRMKGLLGRRSLSRAEGLLITPCRGVHTFGMSFAIDLIFLDRENVVLAVYPEVPPNRLRPIHPSACGVLELAAGRIAETATEPGDIISIETG